MRQKRAAGASSVTCCHFSCPSARNRPTRCQGPSGLGASSSTARAGANESTTPKIERPSSGRSSPRSKISHLSCLCARIHARAVSSDAAAQRWSHGRNSRHRLHPLPTGHEPVGLLVAVRDALRLVALQRVRGADYAWADHAAGARSDEAGQAQDERPHDESLGRHRQRTTCCKSPSARREIRVGTNILI